MSSTRVRMVVVCLALGCASETRTKPEPEPQEENQGGTGGAPRDATGGRGGAGGAAAVGGAGSVPAAGGSGGSSTGGGFDAAAGLSPDAGLKDGATTPDAAAAPMDAAGDGIVLVQLPATSAACGKGITPPDGLVNITLDDGMRRSYYFHAPKTYDANKPWPVMFMFHGSTHSGRSYEGNGPTSGTFGEGIPYHIGPEAILVFPNAPFKTTSNATEFHHSDIPFFEAMVKKVGETVCVDNRRIFVAGHSSGGYFANTLGTRRPNLVRAVASVAGGLGDGTSFTPRGNPAVWLSHGRIDSVNPFARGEEAHKYWAKWNGCASTTKPTTPSPCVAYDNCATATPVHWCPHNEPQYSGTGHGWPSFATKAIWAFFKSLPAR